MAKSILCYIIEVSAGILCVWMRGGGGGEGERHYCCLYSSNTVSV